MTTTSSLSSAAASSTTGATTAASAQQSIAGDIQSFLKLLTTQLKNQDPTQPLDANEFTAQLAQFSGVEQQIATNSNLEKLLSLQGSSAMITAAGLVGKNVQVASSQIGVSNGTAQAVNLPATADAGQAKNAVVTITNSAGTVLRQSVVALGSSATTWQWDGKNSAGSSQADGAYNIAVTGLDAQGASTGSLDVTLSGKVEAVTRVGGTPTLSVQGLSLGLDALRNIN